MNRIAVTGGREYKERAAVYKALQLLVQKHGRFVLVCGMAKGADWLACEWYDDEGRYAGCGFDPFPARWDRYDKSAGPTRNARMVNEILHGVVAFPGGRGTNDMIHRATAAGIPVWKPEWAWKS